MTNMRETEVQPCPGVPGWQEGPVPFQKGWAGPEEPQ